jgi:acyl-CoA synthetase (NDP forming)
VLAFGGVIRCEGAADMATTALLLDDQPLPGGRRLGIVTNAGGIGVLAADAAADAGLEVPALSEESARRLGTALSASAGSGNPVDTGAGASPAQLVEAVGEVITGGEVDAVLVVLVVTSTLDMGEVLTGLAELGRQHPDSTTTLVVLGDADADTGETDGFTRFRDYQSAIVALARAAARRTWLDEGDRPRAAPDLERAAAARALAQEWIAQSGADDVWVSAAQAQELLSAYDLTVCGEVVRGATAAEASARRQGLPVAVKVATMADVHKSDEGLVAVGLTSGTAVRQTVSTWGRRLGGPTEVLVQPMRAGVEMGVGLVREPGVGPMVMVGAGGVQVDVWRDRTFLLGPVTREEVLGAVEDLKVSSLLAGHRGSAPSDLEALAEVVVAVSRLGDEVPEVAELDLNPVLVGPEGCSLVDVRLRLRTARAFTEAPALGRGATRPSSGS